MSNVEHAKSAMKESWRNLACGTHASHSDWLFFANGAFAAINAVIVAAETDGLGGCDVWDVLLAINEWLTVEVNARPAESAP